MGGDEVKTDCWSTNTTVSTWMKLRNLTALGTLGYFQSKIQEIVKRHGKRAMFWDEFWAVSETAELALNTTVAEIRSSSFHELVHAGRLSLTTGINEAWYLDHGIANPRFIQSDWQLYYSHDPFVDILPSDMQYVLGGEVDMCVLFPCIARPRIKAETYAQVG